MPRDSTWWLRWSGPLLAVAVAGAVILRVGSAFGYLALLQIIIVLPWLAPLLFIVAFVKRRAQATTDSPLRRLLLAGLAALLISATGVEQHPYEECLLFACREDSADPVWWSEPLLGADPATEGFSQAA